MLRRAVLHCTMPPGTAYSTFAQDLPGLGLVLVLGEGAGEGRARLAASCGILCMGIYQQQREVRRQRTLEFAGKPLDNP